LAADLRTGVWDNAEILVFLVSWAAVSQGKILLKRGTIGQVALKDTAFTAEMRGLTQALSQQIGELYTPDCRADLGDTRGQVEAPRFCPQLTKDEVANTCPDFAATLPRGLSKCRLGQI
jgi:uncharacterized phage protein (TIGR02218 family)